MRYVKEICIIFGITMTGEILNQLLPLPVPAGVYGLFILLAGLCTGIIKLKDVEPTGNLLLDLMPMMFIPVSVGLIESMDVMRAVLVPFLVITLVSTVIVMAITGKVADTIIKHKKKGEE